MLGPSHRGAAEQFQPVAPSATGTSIGGTSVTPLAGTNAPGRARAGRVVSGRRRGRYARRRRDIGATVDLTEQEDRWGDYWSARPDLEHPRVGFRDFASSEDGMRLAIGTVNELLERGTPVYVHSAAARIPCVP